MEKAKVQAQMALVKNAQVGKGGNFATRKNPFPQRQVIGGAPHLAEVPNLGAVLDAILQSECAIILGRTRDGGAVVLTVLDGENRHRTYCSTSDELDEAITALWNTYEEQ